MSIATEIERLQSAKEALKTSLINKGVEVSDTAKLDEYASLINNISTGAGEDEYFGNYTGGYFQNCIIKLPQNIKVSNLTNMESAFANMKISEVPYFDTSEVTTMKNAFYYTNITSLPNFDLSNVTSLNSAFLGSKLQEFNFPDTAKLNDISYAFNRSNISKILGVNTSLVTTMAYMCYRCEFLTDCIELDAGKVTNISNVFNSCSQLTNFGGFKDLGKAYTSKSTNYSSYTLDLSYCTNLTHDSLMNVINKLYDLNLVYTSTLYSQSLILGTTNKAKLTDEEIAIATNKGWTVS